MSEANKDIPLTALIRFARKTYMFAIQDALKTAGCDDMPRNGIYILGSMARGSKSARQIARQIYPSKEKSSMLIEDLIEHDFVMYQNDNIVLTERGRLAQEVCQSTINTIEADLLEAVSSEYIQHTKTTLAALIDIHDKRHHLPRGER